MTVLDLEGLSIQLAGLVAQGEWQKALSVVIRIERLAREIRKRAEKEIAK